jgi:hypothetical protein
MNIEWGALGSVAVVSIFSSVLFVLLLSFGIRMISVATLRTNQGNSGTAALSAGYALIGLAGLLVLFGLYLIIPQFH